MRFEKVFYRKAGIDAAVEAYGSMASLSVDEQDDAFIVEMAAHDESHSEAIVDHFGNHVLFASLACQMEAS
jgi:hypothetical protein